ncbi:uncharacterized protein DUF4037 [Kribbella sp. VKM Ac-2569]|uniref:DUF4037 domain-containing protein n=1 Tax=Kribbella sp. VKM Ac-2569 TaxID=2512220 RepID=UPI00102C8D8C|nr:DUF4037 domain-containing protein [Kribbella sp. VKM Ac-2569]RZT11936.1 uncharacterized protein DUF4037 [Kribbella sp. VKM Ac-2569]
MGSGLELCRRFYSEVVRPVVGVPHSAGLLGRGSEVLRYDDAMSTDHNCEARVVLFVDDGVEFAPDVPAQFEGRAAFVEVHTIRGYFQQQLGWDAVRRPTVSEWFTFPEHVLLMMTAGAVFHDDLGLQDVRDRLAYYPDDVWRYLMIAAWWRVHPEMNLVGRSGYVGDELGSALLGSQLAQDLMRLCFLMERRYAPYSKWFGTAFGGLSCGPSIGPLCREVLRSETWQEREKALSAVYRAVGELHNRLAITAPVELGVERMWGRPFEVVWGDFPGALSAAIQDPEVRRIADRWPVGGIEQVRDVLHRTGDRRQLLGLLDSR